MNGFAVGKQHKAFRNSVEFFKALAEISGLDVDAEHSTLRMGTYIVFFNSPLPNPNRRGKAVEAIVGPKGEEVKTEELQVRSASYEAILAEAEALNDESDKKGSKDKLADLAATKGITLAKNKSFENMMADFKAALEELEPAK
ncbi:inhibitor of prohead protease [Salmonella phage 19]|nr:virulence-associated protein E [Salmonella phage 41]AKJ74510.1 inhibitor of prohead protease [Salmonella phage 19]